ncbi:MAG: phospholipase D-like domain-containing protein [Ignavibacteriota bacterium]
MQDVGIGVHKIRHLRLHAKTLLADKSRAIIGSINLSTGSLDKRRELAIRIEATGGPRSAGESGAAGLGAFPRARPER